MKKVLFPFLVLLGAGAVAAVLIFARDEPESRPYEVIPTPVEVMLVESSPTTLTVLAQGTVAPRLQADLAAEVGGLVIETSDRFEAGKFVEEGEILLELDPTDYEAAEAEALANLRSAETSLLQAEADAEQAIRDLREVGVKNPTPLARREPQLEQARLRVDSAEAALDLAKKNLARTKIRAPFDGQVIETLVNRGDVLSGRGTPVGTLYGTDYGEVRLPLAREDIFHLSLPDAPGEIAASEGSKPRVTLSLGSGSDETRKIGWIDRLAGTTDSVTRLRPAIALFRDPLDTNGAGESAIPFGSFVAAEIEGRRFATAFRIPNVALVGEDRVRIIDEENRLQERTIKIEQRTPMEMVITEGLEDGDRVCLTPLRVFTPGMRVRPADEEGEEDRPPDTALDQQPDGSAQPSDEAQQSLPESTR